MERSELNKVIEQAVGGAYRLADGREFWIDRATALEVTDRIAKALEGYEFRRASDYQDPRSTTAELRQSRLG